MGKEPVHKDVLTMAGSRYGRQSEKRDAGMVLRSHDLKDIDFWFQKQEWWSGARWARRAWLERCLVKLVTDSLNFSREERREHGWQFSCTVRGGGGEVSSAWGVVNGFFLSSAKKFVHGGVEFLGWRRVNDAVVWFWWRYLVSGGFLFLFNKFVCGRWFLLSAIDVLPANAWLTDVFDTIKII